MEFKCAEMIGSAFQNGRVLPEALPCRFDQEWHWTWIIVEQGGRAYFWYGVRRVGRVIDGNVLLFDIRRRK
jgi:hypothetical protein